MPKSNLPDKGSPQRQPDKIPPHFTTPRYGLERRAVKAPVVIVEKPATELMSDWQVKRAAKWGSRHG